MIAPLWWLCWATPMHNPDEQATLETAMGWLGLGIVVLLLVLILVIVLVPTLRLAAGVLLLLVGLFAWGEPLGGTELVAPPCNRPRFLLGLRISPCNIVKRNLKGRSS